MSEIIYPSLFSNSKKITAGFTLAARETINSNGTIAGLNTGENTEAPKEEIEDNLQRVASRAGLSRDQFVLGVQVHSNNVLFTKKPGFYAGYDGYVTRQTGLVLGIKVADCAALLFADEENSVIGAAHAGWKGAVAGIVPNTLHTMKQHGASADKIKVYLSPCISVQKFEVGEEVAVQFPDEVVDRQSYQKPHVDLKEYLRLQLEEAGIMPEHIEIDDRCTMSDPQFYSYRRERERAGRMLGFITLNESQVS